MQSGYLLAGRYQLLEIIGTGGMATVYRGRELELNREVAIKVMAANLASHRDYVERFNREAQTVAALHHANIIQIYFYGVDVVGSFVVMPLLKGGTLHQRMRQTPHLVSIREVGELAQKVGSALHYAHQHNIIHRDIKFSNIMFDQNGNPNVMDFGIAKLIDATQLTGTSAPIGTPQFMPPEQWRGLSITPAVDQYAFAVVLYQLLTGRAPLEGQTSETLMYKHLQETPPPANTYRQDIPDRMVQALDTALAKDPYSRFATMEDFAHAMYDASFAAPATKTNFFTFPLKQDAPQPIPATGSQRFATGQPGTYPPPSSGYYVPPTQASSNNIVLPVVIVLMALVAVVAGYFLMTNNPDNTLASTQTSVAIAITAQSLTESTGALQRNQTQQAATDAAQVLHHNQTQQAQANIVASAQQNQTERAATQVAAAQQNQAGQVTSVPTLAAASPPATLSVTATSFVTDTPHPTMTIAPTQIPTVVTYSIGYGGTYSSNPNNVAAEEWKFYANHGDIITIIMQSNVFNTQVSLYRDGEFIATQSTGATSTIGNLEITRSDTYTIVAQSIQATMSGSYNITLTQFLPTDTPVPTIRPTNTLRPTSLPTSTHTPASSASTGNVAQLRCDDAYGPHFQLGDRFFVPFGDGPTSVWEEPNNEPRVGRIYEGEEGVIIGGPVCVGGQDGNLVAWQVEADNGVIGWVSEGYLHSPVPWIAPIGGAATNTNTTRSTNVNLLMNGTGQTTRQRVTNGEFQVEYYCPRHGYGTGISNNNNEWYCTRNGSRTRTLNQNDFNQICRDTYGVTDAVARQDGSGRIAAYRWRCYG